jgi:hypothetical protein
MFHDRRTNYREGAVRIGETLELYAEYHGERAQLFRLRAANIVLRMLSDPIDLIYDSDGRLREFISISNSSHLIGNASL